MSVAKWYNTSTVVYTTTALQVPRKAALTKRGIRLRLGSKSVSPAGSFRKGRVCCMM
jgi:hypothetical protein